MITPEVGLIFLLYLSAIDQYDPVAMMPFA